MHMIVQMPEKKRIGRNYTEEFRAEAVQLLNESGKSTGQLASDIGVNINSLRAWAKRASADAGVGKAGVANSSELEELRALRKENRELRMERDFLKKAAVFFAKDQDRPSR